MLASLVACGGEKKDDKGGKGDGDKADAIGWSTADQDKYKNAFEPMVMEYLVMNNLDIKVESMKVTECAMQKAMKEAENFDAFNKNVKPEYVAQAVEGCLKDLGVAADAKSEAKK